MSRPLRLVTKLPLGCSPQSIATPTPARSGLQSEWWVFHAHVPSTRTGCGPSALVTTTPRADVMSGASADASAGTMSATAATRIALAVRRRKNWGNIRADLLSVLLGPASGEAPYPLRTLNQSEIRNL